MRRARFAARFLILGVEGRDVSVSTDGNRFTDTVTTEGRRFTFVPVNVGIVF